MAVILVVEDHALSRQLLTTLLGQMGHDVREAPDGSAALTLSLREQPDLIICDILLPNTDGLEFVRQLRDSTPLRETPVIFYTATCRLPEDLGVGETYRNCRVIPKPSDPVFILQAVNEALGLPPPSLPGHSATGRTLSARSESFHSASLRLAVLMDLSYSMVAQRDPKLLLSTVTKAFADMLCCARSLLAVRAESGQTLFYSGYPEEEPGTASGSDLCPPLDVLDGIAADRRPARLGQGSLLVLPFASPSRVYGWLCLGGRADAAPFTDEDEELAMTLSLQSALAYENILLVEQLRSNGTYLEELVRQRTAELERANAELLKVEKLESLGVLAGGIAHDFNNELTAIINHIRIARSHCDPKDRSYRHLGLAEEACHDAVSLTRQLLTFAKGGHPARKATDLQSLTRHTVEFVLRGSNVSCEFCFCPEPLIAEVDPGQMRQVIGNLVINAQQAMPAGGMLTVSAEEVMVAAGTHLCLKGGRYIRLCIVDRGVGIPDSHLHKIFDPYFTTKEVGSGLGLTTAYSIVKNHGGQIAVESKEGEGTTFHVYLPASDGQLAVEGQSEETCACGGRVLLVEDQASIARSLAELLELYGYAVDTASDGREGLELYQQAMDNGPAYEAVILDLTIPGGMGGKETINRLRAMDPSVKAIVSSGYSNDPVMSDYPRYGFSGAIAKPYHIEDIVEELRRLAGPNGRLSA